MKPSMQARMPIISVEGCRGGYTVVAHATVDFYDNGATGQFFDEIIWVVLLLSHLWMSLGKVGREYEEWMWI